LLHVHTWNYTEADRLTATKHTSQRNNGRHAAFFTMQFDPSYDKTHINQTQTHKH